MPRNRRKSRPQDKHAAEERIEHLKVELFLGVLVLVLFTCLKLWFEHSSSGGWLARQAHLWLQRRIRPATYDVPVVVVDITDLRRKEYHVTNGPSPTVFFTPREDLEALIASIASKHPAAIGVDIDLSIEPELKPDSRLVRASENLFERALRRTNSVGGQSVFFGIKRNEGREPAQWLGSSRYIPLATSLARPKGLVLRMPSEFEFPGHTNRLVSLSKAMATAFQESNGHIRPMRDGVFIQPVSVEMPLTAAPEFRVREFVVDYSPMTRLVDSKVVSFDKVASEPASTFSNKLVFLGDAKQFQGADTAIVPGQEEPVPGVFIQACAAYTLALAPLWRLAPWAGMMFALVSSFAGLLLIHRVCRKLARHHSVTTVPLTILVTFATIGFFLLAAWLAVALLHILWVEVIIVCLFLVLECFAELFLTHLNFNSSWANSAVHWSAKAGGYIYAPAVWLGERIKLARTNFLKLFVLGAHKK